MKREERSTGVSDLPDEGGKEENVRLIFVDDEPLLLQGLQRSLRSMAGEWTMDFVSSGAEALAKMESVPVDVVVTDMRMLGMDGAQLLQEVQKRHPETVRFVLSGQSIREAVLRFIGRSHQFLSKPCDIKELKGRIEAAFLLRNLLGSARVKEVISKLTSVPSLPALYDEIMGELESKDPSAARVGDIVARDVAMAAKVLQLANSALLGLRCQISNVHQAVLLIGVEMMRALVVSVHIFSHCDADRLGDLDLARLWKHSLCTANVALGIARAEHAPKQVQEDSFSAGHHGDPRRSHREVDQRHGSAAGSANPFGTAGGGQGPGSDLSAADQAGELCAAARD